MNGLGKVLKFNYWTYSKRTTRVCRICFSTFPKEQGARQILQYGEDDELIRDKKGKKLSKKFFESIETQNKELIKDTMASIREEMEDKSPEEMDSLMDTMNKFLDMNSIELMN